MGKDWIKGKEGRNLKFKRETLLNYGANRWALNKTASVDKVAFLIRNCAPKAFGNWEKYYFGHAKQNKKGGKKITKEYITSLGEKLFQELSSTVKSELSRITKEECIDYMYNLVLNRTYEGYLSEIQTVYGELQKELGIEVKRAPDEWDRRYNVDYFIEVKGKCIGLQIKPILSGMPINNYQWAAIQDKTHAEFKAKFGGEVFFIYSITEGKKKIIANPNVIPKIKEEIARLSG